MGTQLFPPAAAGRKKVRVELTASGNLVIPTGVSEIDLTLIGGGGGGTLVTATNSTAIGGEGGRQWRGRVPVVAGSTYAATIGAAGLGGSGSGYTAGSSGGTTSIVIGGGTYSAAGGNGGGNGPSTPNRFAGTQNAGVLFSTSSAVVTPAQPGLDGFSGGGGSIFGFTAFPGVGGGGHAVNNSGGSLTSNALTNAVANSGGGGGSYIPGATPATAGSGASGLIVAEYEVAA